MGKSKNEFEFIWKDTPTEMKNRTSGAGVTFSGKYVKVKKEVKKDGIDKASADRAN